MTTTARSEPSSSTTTDIIEKYKSAPPQGAHATQSMQNEAHRLSQKVMEVNMRRKRLV